MRVLWICNLVLPEFADEYGIKRTSFGGWMSGMLCALSGESDVKIGLCFPIIDERRMKNGECLGHKYYSFHAAMNQSEYSDTLSNEFIAIYRDFSPDIIYIWGTEYNHVRAAVLASMKMGIERKIVIHIQGFVRYYALHYANGIPEAVTGEKYGGNRSIADEIKDFSVRGENEKWILQNVYHVCGRTEWDKCCALRINPFISYHSCGEILRYVFYKMAGNWNISNVANHRIFLSQASYPVKGLHIFLRAATEILKNFPDSKIRIGGKSPLESKNSYGQYIGDLMNEYGLAEKIEFLDTLTAEEMAEEFLSSHVFVSPSTIENSSNSIGEAMLLGVPTVASYVGGTPSLISHKDTGFLYQRDAFYMLAYYIMNIFRDDALATRISEAAKRVAKERYDSAAIKTRMIEIYRKVAASEA